MTWKPPFKVTLCVNKNIAIEQVNGKDDIPYIMENNILVGGIPTPLKTDGVRQLG